MHNASVFHLGLLGKGDIQSQLSISICFLMPFPTEMLDLADMRNYLLNTTPSLEPNVKGQQGT